ncbi:hypothetical protein IAT38_002824 [Cryptococcus sp. DSM 104549]
MPLPTSRSPLLSPTTPSRTSTTSHIALLLSLFALLSLLALLAPCPISPINFFSPPPSSLSPFNSNRDTSTLREACAQADPFIPPVEVHNISKVWDAKSQIIEWHRGAIRIPTMSYDEMGAPGEDERWEVFGKLHEYLEEAYPLVHKHLKRTKVDTYGLVYEWFGSDESLQPLFLTAHQDVVPVLPDTLYQWEHPPFEAVYDGKYIHGRGSDDDKSGLTSILASIELLLSTSSFSPRRTIILGFGHDEERGGLRGAPSIRDFLLDKYGASSMALLVDEGSGIQEIWGQTFGMPAVAEKGRFNLNLTVSSLGGHSSIPPKNTAVGIAAKLISALEDDPFPLVMKKDHPVWGFLQCAVGYAEDMPEKVRDETVRAIKGDVEAFEGLPEVLVEEGLGESWATAGMGSETQYLLSTSQAVDIISGGFKVNALPEVVTVISNYRIDISSSVSAVTSRLFHTLLPVAASLSLSLSGFDHSYTPPPSTTTRAHVSLSPAFENGLEPAPISPTDLGTPAWKILAGTSRGVWASRKAVSDDGRVVELDEQESLVMAPGMGTGNTDTRRYWDLTKNIYRWRYFPDSENQGAHTVNERVNADSIVEFVRFYTALILNVDASREL